MRSYIVLVMISLLCGTAGAQTDAGVTADPAGVVRVQFPGAPGSDSADSTMVLTPAPRAGEGLESVQFSFTATSATLPEELTDRKKVPVSLVGAVQMALTRNRLLSVKRLDPAIARARVQAEKGVFSETLAATLRNDHRETPTGSQLDGARVLTSDDDTRNLNFQSRLRSGGTAGLQFNNLRRESNSAFQNLNPQYTSNLIVSLTQPLLRGGGGKAATANLRVARNGQRQALLRLEKQVIDTVAAVERQYWDLVFARRDLQVKRFALHGARELLSYNKRRQEVGLGSDVQIIESEATEALREEDVELSRRQVEDAQEILRRQLSMGHEPVDAEIVPLDGPTVEPKNSALASALEKAYRLRPDYLDAKIELESRDIRVAFLRNQKRPRVDLVSSYAQNGVAGSFATAVDQVKSGDFPSYAFGFTVELPIDNRAARGEYHRGQLEKRQALLNLKALEDQIEEEVIRAVRSLATDLQRVKITHRGERTASLKLRAEESRYQQGLIANFDLLRFQQELAEARSRALRASVEVQKSSVNVEAATGDFLPARGIVVRDVANMADPVVN